MCPRRLMQCRPWDRFGWWGLGREDVNAPQQAKGQVSSENIPVATVLESASAISGAASQLGCGRCFGGSSFIAIQIKGLESTGSLPMGPVLSPLPVCEGN